VSDEDRPVPNEPQDPAPPEARPPARPTPLRSVDRRGPPTDAAAEAAVLGAVLQRADVAWEAAAVLSVADFTWPGYGHVFGAMQALAGDGEPIHPISVSDQLRRMGLLEQVAHHTDPTRRGAAVVHMLGAADIAYQHVAGNVTIVTRCAAGRRLMAAAHQLREAGLALDLDAAGPALDEASRVLTQSSVPIATSWTEVDVAALLAGGLDPVLPTMLARSDGQCLVYPGRTHAFNAEPEAGKSWLAMVACAHAMTTGGHVAYLDFESDGGSVLERLVALGVTHELLTERFHYVRPDEPLTAAARARLLDVVHQHTPDLVVIDGVAEVMALNGWDEASNTDSAAFLTSLPRLLEREGCAVVMIDHVVKAAKDQGRYARGAGHKLAGLSGAAYKLEVIKPFGRGLVGRARITVTKDRPGWVRRGAPMSRVGEFELASSADGTAVEARLLAPSAAADGSNPFRPTGYMERVSKALEELADTGEAVTLAQIRKIVSGKAAVIDKAVECLVEEGFVERVPGSRSNSFAHRSVRPFRELVELAEEAAGDEYDGPFDGGPEF